MHRQAIILVFLTAAGGDQLGATSGFDTGLPVGAAVNMTGDARGATQWIRIHSRAFDQSSNLETPTDKHIISSNREALTRIRAEGASIVCMTSWSADYWTSFINGGGNGNRQRFDLRQAYARARSLSITYGDLVNVWEVDNEPDIYAGHNADVFAAYHKAVALGLADGRRARAAQITKDQCPLTKGVLSWALDLGEGAASGLIREYPRNPRLRFGAGRAPRGQVAPPTRSLVLMAAPGLPPGPHFEQLLANGYLSYTEGFNYHYYGFAMDYAGVYQQFHDAVAELRAGADDDGSLKPEMRKVTRRLPVFLTEWGYSLLDGYDAQTVEGRVRQWRYFADVAEQNERLRVAAPMAFLLRPYFEIKAKEFGLGMPADAVRAAHYGFVVAGAGTGSAGFQPAFESFKPAGRDAGAPSEEPKAAEASTMGFSAGGLTFSPEDFAKEGVAPWMERIGERVGDAEASPALAWLLDNAGMQSRTGWFGLWPKRGPRDWIVRTEAPSPVVMDFVAGGDVRAVKSDHGYWLWGHVRAGGGESALAVREGAGVMVFYNFGPEPVRVTPVWPEWIRPADTNARGKPVLPGDADALTLAPGERREVAVVLRARADRLLPVDARIAAEVRCGEVRTISRWASRFYALPNGVLTRERDRFDFPADAAEANRALLQARPLAPEEPSLRRDGRWLVTDGMRVEETDWGWRLHVDHFPGTALRPAVAELPLPEGWCMPTGAMLSYDYRMIDGAGAVELSAATPDARLRRQTGIAGNLAESYIRTSTGNLFGTQPRLSPKSDWRSYQQSAETFTMHFLGRTVPPWRFSEHKPAALVFFVRPVRLPAVFEVRNPQVIEMVSGR